MNRLYRLVWNARQNAWIAAPESAKGRSKGGGGKRLLAVMLLTPGIALAAPTGGTVTSGTATISQNGAVTNVVQGSQKASINWQGFSISTNETVNFNQPNRSAIALNRVIGNERSIIDGALNANGQVFLINSNGVLFGKGSSVIVGGLVASTRDISDADFNAGRYQFNGEGGGSVINLGTLRAEDGGYIALLGKQATNQGVIVATRGTVALSAGDKITLDFNGDSLIRVTLDRGTLDALVENRQAILADGGTVYLSAKAADEVLGAQVNNSGIVRARTIDDLSGRIELHAHGGTTNVDGTLDASAPTAGDGGFVETSGQVVNVADSAFVTTRAGNGRTGLWLIDPNDFTVAASGGNMTGEAVSNALANNDFSIDTHTMGTPGHGDIHIDDRITWSSDNTLTLTAERDIHINNAITTDGANAALVLNYGGDYDIRTKASYSGAMSGTDGMPVAKQDTSGGVYGSISFTNDSNTDGLTINGDRYTLIHTVEQLAAIDDHPNNTATGHFALARDVDAAALNNTATGGTVFGVVNILSGTLAGLGHDVLNLSIDAPTTSNVGLVGQSLAGSVIRDIGLVNANITAQKSIGALLGWGANTTVRNVHATGSVTSASINAGNGNNIGGLVGRLQGGSLSRVFADVTVNGWQSVGGLLGAAQVNGSVGVSVSETHASGAVNGKAGNVGGLVGSLAGSAQAGASIAFSYATGNVTVMPAGNYHGGLVGMAGNYSSISHSFSTGNVTSGGSSSYVGGLVGQNYGTIDHAYATGDVSAKISVGGLVGNNNVNSLNNSVGGTITESSASGSVTGVEVVGGLVGGNGQYATISNSKSSGPVTATGLADDNGVLRGGIAGGLVGANYGTVVGGIASGSVSSVPGFAGGLAGLNGGVGVIRDSIASGHVSGGKIAGGLIGDNAGEVTGSIARGDVVGGESVGGLIGENIPDINGSDIRSNLVSDNIASGSVTGDDRVGGLVGSATGGDFRNNAWNTDSTGQSEGMGFTGGHVTQDGMFGLNADQFEDAEFYLNGTIDQVLADRAAAKAATEAAERAAAAELAFRTAASAVAGNEVGQALSDQPKPDAFANLSTRSPVAVALDQNVVIAPPKHYGADVRSIEVDGKVFMLEDEDKNKKPRAVQPE
jgi:filamentous hemagglutinin family protein